MDIEEIGESAKVMKICGYFSSRKAMSEADLIITPYQSILSEATRNSLGISLNNKILVFDEGHNIMETICSLNTVQITQGDLRIAEEHIKVYAEKYGSRLAPKNLKMIAQIQKILATLAKYLGMKAS